MYGTVVKINDSSIDYNKLQRVIDEKYLEIVLKENNDAALNIKQKKTFIESQQTILQQKEQAWYDKKLEIKERCKNLDIEIGRMNEQIANIQATIIKLTSYGRGNTAGLVNERNMELQSFMEEKKKLEIKKAEVVLEGEPFEEEYAAAYDKLQALKKDLKDFEDSL